jgi:hypothetical protein
MSDTKLEEYFEREETLRVLMEANHQAYVKAAEEYDGHRRRLTTLGDGSKSKRYLDGQEV